MADSQPAAGERMELDDDAAAAAVNGDGPPPTATSSSRDGSRSRAASDRATTTRDTKDSLQPSPEPPVAVVPTKRAYTKRNSGAPKDTTTGDRDSTTDSPNGYGTRSRKRTSARPNYAEDNDMDFEVSTATPVAATSTSDFKRSRSESSASLSPPIEDGLSPPPSSHKRKSFPASGTSTPQSISEPFGKATSHGAHATNGASTAGPPPAKKRKTGTTTTGHGNTGHGGRRPGKSARSSAEERASDMSTFEKSRAYLRDEKLVADDGTEYGINDHVYLVCEPPGEPYYLARIMEFVHGNGKDSPVEQLRVSWFYRPRDVQRTSADSRLLYATMHSDTSPISSLRGKCTIQHRSEVGDLDEYRKNKDSFYFAQLFDRFIRRWYDCIPTTQIINVPEKVKKALDERWKYVAVENSCVKDLTRAVKTCKRCSGYAASNDSVDCALCHSTYHLNCVRPPLPKKPSRGFAWACGPCSIAQEKKLEARHNPLAGEGENEDEELLEEEEDDGGVPDTTAPSPEPTDLLDHHPGTQAEIALARMWPMRYLGLHARVEDALQYDDRAIYPRASSRLGPRHQANVNVWHGHPVEYVKRTDSKRRYVRQAGHKKDTKPSKEALAAAEAERAEKAKRPKWVQDEPVGFVHRGEDHPNKDPKNTARTIFRMPTAEDLPERGLDDAPENREALVDSYMEKATAIAPEIGLKACHTNFLDKALEYFLDSNYHEETALARLRKVDKRKDLKEPIFTKDEKARFEEGVAKYGSEHRLIRLHMNSKHSNGAIVRYYYMWKKTLQGRKIWGGYENRKSHGKKLEGNNPAARLVDDVADDYDDSAFDSNKAAGMKRGFICKFCQGRKSRQWRRAPGVPPGTTTVVESKNGTGKESATVALCVRDARLWRKYAIKWEDTEEIQRKIAQGGVKALRKKVDEELLNAIIASMEAPESEDEAPPAQPNPTEKKKTKASAAATEKDGTPAAEKKQKQPAAPVRAQTPPPPPPEPPKLRELPCAICLRMSVNGNERLCCVDCRLTIHRQCYGVDDKTGPDNWVCDMCLNDRNPQASTEYVCRLCPIAVTPMDLFEQLRPVPKKKADRDRERERAEKELAVQVANEYRKSQVARGLPTEPREALKQTAGNNWVHVTCAVWTPEIRFSDAKCLGRAEGLGLIPQTRFEQPCKWCKGSQGACVLCHQCHAPIHVECAREAGYTFGFDVTPVKSTRKDAVPTITLGEETGAAVAAIWCKDHAIKTIVHAPDEQDPETRMTALQQYVRTYKQADLTLTGTVRRANLVQQSTKALSQMVPAASSLGDRRVSAAGQRAAATKAAKATVNHAAQADDTDALQKDDDDEADNEEKTCGRCESHFSPKWWPVVEQRSSLAHGMVNGYGGDVFKQSDTATSPRWLCHKCHKKGLRPPSPPHEKPAAPPPQQSSAPAQPSVHDRIRPGAPLPPVEQPQQHQHQPQPPRAQPMVNGTSPAHGPPPPMPLSRPSPAPVTASGTLPPPGWAQPSTATLNGLQGPLPSISAATSGSSYDHSRPPHHGSPPQHHAPPPPPAPYRPSSAHHAHSRTASGHHHPPPPPPPSHQPQMAPYPPRNSPPQSYAPPPTYPPMQGRGHHHQPSAGPPPPHSPGYTNFRPPPLQGLNQPPPPNTNPPPRSPFSVSTSSRPQASPRASNPFTSHSPPMPLAQPRPWNDPPPPPGVFTHTHHYGYPHHGPPHQPPPPTNAGGERRMPDAGVLPGPRPMSSHGHPPPHGHMGINGPATPTMTMKESPRMASQPGVPPGPLPPGSAGKSHERKPSLGGASASPSLRNLLS